MFSFFNTKMSALSSLLLLFSFVQEAQAYYYCYGNGCEYYWYSTGWAIAIYVFLGLCIIGGIVACVFCCNQSGYRGGQVYGGAPVPGGAVYAEPAQVLNQQQPQDTAVDQGKPVANAVVETV